jgi:hypothetical protein
MSALKGHRLAIVMAAADKLPAEKRPVFFDRVAARLRVQGFRFTDADLHDAVRHALQGVSREIEAPSDLQRRRASITFIGFVFGSLGAGAADVDIGAGRGRGRGFANRARR